MSRRPAPSRLRIPLTVLSAGVLVVSATSCSLFEDETQKALDTFASALGARDAAAAAAVTSDPAAAQESIQASLDGMGDATPTVAVAKDGDDRGTVTTTWDVGRGHTAQTVGTATVSDGTIAWAPSVLDDRLQPGGRLLYADDPNLSTTVVDRTGATVMSWQPVTVVSMGEDAAAQADAVAAAVSGPAPTVTGQSIRDGIAGAARENRLPYTVVSLREDDIAPVRDTVAAIPGVTLTETGRLVTADRAVSSPALAEIPDVWQDAVTETAGWTVAADNPATLPDGTAGTDQDIASGPGTRAPDLTTTLDVPLQLAAQRAVDAETRPAVVVALQPSTGGIVAVAQNDAADAQGPIALSGLFAPGSTFKTVTTSAALAAGVVTPDEIVPCPARATVEGRSIPNDDDFDLGEVPMHTAFARSCNTTQAQLAVQLPPTALTDTAASLGLGVDFTTPGITTVTGTVPETEGGSARVEAAIGQGQVVASPFGMAEVAATIAHGTVIPPILIEGEPGTADRTAPPVAPEVLDAVRAMMAEAVASGTATQLAGIDGLIGKTGTAEVEGKPANGWFVGIRGDLAFATLVEGGESSGPALTVSGAFLGS